MTFVNDSGQVLDIDGDLAITKQSVSFFGFKINGDYSVNFTIPKNSYTCDVLGYYGPQMNSQVAFSRQTFTAIDNDGNILNRGSIVIQDDTNTELNCFYVSGNSNWINKFNGLVTELDFSGYRTQWTYANIGSSATSGITFPLVDWIYGLKKGNNTWFMSKLFDKDSDATTEVEDIGVSYSEFQPCFFLSSLVTEIFQQNGVKYAGTVFDDMIYKRLLLTPYQQIKRQAYPKVSANGTLYTAAASSTYEKYDKFVESYDLENLFSSSRYTFSRYGTVTITVTCITNLDDHILDFAIRKNNVAQVTFSSIVGGGPLVGQFITYEITGVPNDYVEIWVFSDVVAPAFCTITLNIDITFNQIIGPKDYVTPNDFLFPFAQLDIVKFIVNYFGCVAYYDDYNKTVTINILDKFTRESALNWSDYYISHRSEYTVVQAQNNFVRMLDPDDSVLQTYNTLNAAPFGGGNITTNNRLKFSNDLFTIPFAPSDYGLSLNFEWLANIGLITLTDGDPIPYTTITNSGGLAQFSLAASKRQIARIASSSGQVISGYFIGDGTGCYYGLNYVSNGSGNFYLQTITYNTIQPRLLLSKPTSTIDFSNDSTITVYESGSGNSLGTVQYAFFAKKVTGKTIDQYKVSGSWGIINSNQYADTTISEMYFNNISNILNNPTVRAQLLLPKAVFQSFQFDQFIYLKTKDLIAYFVVDSIVNYTKSSVQVEGNLYLLN